MMNQTVIASEETTKKAEKIKQSLRHIFSLEKFLCEKDTVRTSDEIAVFFFQMHGIRYTLSSNRMVFYSYQSHVKQKFKFSKYCVCVR